MNWNLFKRERDLLDIFHVLITIGIAIGGFAINQKQAELNRKLEREGATQTFADQVFEHLGSLTLNAAEKQAMVIDLLDIITESNISKTGELSDVERRQLMPLRMALFTKNHEILSHIGADSSKRDLWVSFAERSGNAKVKMTAIRALENLGIYGSGEHDLMFSLKKILSLGEELNDLNGYLLTNTALAHLVLSMDLETTRALIEASPSDSSAIVNVYNFLFKVSSGLQTALTGSVISEMDSLRESLDMVKAATNQLAELLDFNLGETQTREVGIVDPRLTYNIKKLKSEISSERKSARIALASYGEYSIEYLMKYLDNNPDEYQVRLGVASALNLMQQPVIIDDEEYVHAIVGLIGDPKAEIRKESSRFLAKLSDAQTIDFVFEELKRVIEMRSNGNAVYNAFVVLISWNSLGIHAAKKEGIRAFMRNERDILAKDRRWSKTVTQIDNFFIK